MQLEKGREESKLKKVADGDALGLKLLADALHKGQSLGAVAVDAQGVALDGDLLAGDGGDLVLLNTCAASFVQEAGITALEKAEPDVQEMVKEYARRRDYMVSAINSMDGVSCKTPGGAFYVFMNIKSFGMTSADMANYLLEEAKIATVPGSAFGSQGEGYVRFSYACSYERIVEGMERMRKALAKLPKKA